MELYIVKARLFIDEYRENVLVIKDLEEKEKSFVKKGVRILKSDINQLADDYGDVKYTVRNRESIDDARALLKEVWKNRTLDELNKVQLKMEALSLHNVNSEVKNETSR